MRTQSLVPAGTLYQAIPKPSLPVGVQSAIGPGHGNFKDLTYLQDEGEGTVEAQLLPVKANWDLTRLAPSAPAPFC